MNSNLCEVPNLTPCKLVIYSKSVHLLTHEFYVHQHHITILFACFEGAASFAGKNFEVFQYKGVDNVEYSNRGFEVDGFGTFGFGAVGVDSFGVGGVGSCLREHPSARKYQAIRIHQICLDANLL